MVEDNGFQRWLLDALLRRPRAHGYFFGHRTGSNKANAQEGIPGLAFAFQGGLWAHPQRR